MIKTHVYIGTSLDGFIASSDGSFDWLTEFADQEAVDAYKSFIAEIDVIVIGRHTFETVLRFPVWPYHRPVVVVSRSVTTVPSELRERLTLSKLEPRDLLFELAERGFQNAYIDGGKLVQSFLADDLIDELIIAKVPMLLGDGIPLFGHLSRELRFEHQRTATFSNGLIRSYYLRKKN